MRRAILALVVCVPLLMSAPRVVFAQTDPAPPRLPTTIYGVEQGLSHGAAYALALDRRGFLWVGTGFGLNRFDGGAFKPFNPDPADTTALADAFVGVLLADGDALWVGTGRGGLHRLDLRTERFRRFRHDPTTAPGLGADQIAALAFAPGGLYVGTLGGLFHFDVRHARFTRRFGRDDPRGTLPVPRVRALLSEPDGTLWIGADDGLYRFHPGDTLRSVPGVPGVVITLCRTPDGGLLAGTQQGLYLQSPGANAFVRMPQVPSAMVYSVAAERSGVLWVGTAAGLLRLAPGASVPEQVNAESTRDLVFDAQGRLWAATSGNGLMRLHPGPPSFRALAPQQAFNGLFVEESGVLWAATTTGVVRVRPGQAPEQRPGHAGVVNDIEGRAGGPLYLARTAGVFRYDPLTGRETPLRAAGLPQSYSANRLLLDSSGALWVSTATTGVLRIDLARGTARPYHPDTTGGFPHVYSWALLETRDGTLWVGTMGGGLARYDPVRDAFHVYRFAANDPHSLPGDRVLALHEAEDDRLWVGTMGTGLASLDPRSGRFIRFGRSDGLPEDHAYGLASDAAGDLWIASSTALSRLDPRTRRVVTYTRRDGLPAKGFLWSSSARSADGTLYFGTGAGVVAFRPDRMPPVPPPPPVAFTDVRLFNRSAPLDTAAPALERIELDYDQNFLSFNFAALDLDAPEAHTYRYRLDGLDTGWVDAGPRDLADYPNLAHGHYTMHVQAARFGSNTFGPPATLAVIVHPPFWATWWFRTLAILLLLALAYTGYRVRIENLLRVERTRRRIADDLHDDLGTKLSTLATQLELSGQYGPPEAAPGALVRFSESTRTLVGDLRDTVWVIDGQRDTLASLTDRIETAAFNLLGSGRFSCERPATLPAVPLPMEQRRHVFLLLKEALHNAHRHAGGAPVRLTVEATPEQAVFTVSDTGPGFDVHALRNRGQGLGALARRAQAGGVHLALHSAPGAGTSVRVAMPLKPASWKRQMPLLRRLRA